MLGLFRKKPKQKKAVVLGLDGVPHTLLLDYMARGLMPELKSLVEKGSLMRMRSTIPEISSVAWTSFQTGVNPAEHGIFGFMEIDRRTYEYTFPNFDSLRVRPFWERDDIRTVALNIPQTYPARRMNGAMVSGFVALDLKKATYPDHVYEYLKGIGYAIDVNARLAAESPRAFFDNMFETFAKRRKAIAHLYDTEDWRLFIGTVTETDRLHHFYFDSAREGEHYAIFERFYRELDAFIGEMAARAKRDGAVFLTCSDHGFTVLRSEVYLNRWLMENGFLRLTSAEGLKGITLDSRAFCLDPARIYVHRDGVYAKGPVKDPAPVIEELKQRFEALEFEGSKVVNRVFTRQEVFHGPHAADGPDLCLLTNYGFDLKGAVNRDQVFGRAQFRGMHTYDDAHLFVSEPVKLEDPGIENVPGVIKKFL